MERVAYSLKEVAQMTGQSEHTLKYHVHEGILKAKKVGKRWLVTKESLNEYIGNSE